MFEVFYLCDAAYRQKVEDFVHLWLSGVENLEVKTSGSTGKPKIISLSRKQILASILNTKKAFSLKKNESMLMNLNIDFIAGKLMILRAIEIKMSIFVVEPSNNPFEKTGNLHFDFLSFVPTQIEFLLQNPKSIAILNQAKNIIIGGAAVGQHLENQIQQLKPNVYATYGMTETVTHIALKKLNGVDKSTFFSVLEGVEIRKNKDNCLEIKSETTDNQWIKTKDIVSINENQSFQLIGRKDNIINSGGIKIQLEKIEKKLEKYISKRFFCWGMKEEKLGQQLVVFIESIEKIKINNEMITFDKYETPKTYFCIPKFIETASGKIDKIKTVNEFIKNTVPNP